MKTSLVTPTTGDIEALGNNATTLILTSQHTAESHTLKPDPLTQKKAQAKVPPPPPVRGRKRSLPPPPPAAVPTPSRAATPAKVEMHSALPESLAEELMKFDAGGEDEEDLAMQFDEDAFETTGSRLVKRLGGWFGRKTGGNVKENVTAAPATRPRHLPPPPVPGKKG